MLDEFKLQRRLRKLQRQRDNALAEPSGLIDAARKAKNRELEEQWVADYLMVRDEWEDQIDSFVTRFLRNKAERYMLPLPELNDDLWRESKTALNVHYLTRAGMAQLRALIREYEKDERERLSFWITSLVGVLGGIIGVIGVLIAYAALSQKP